MNLKPTQISLDLDDEVEGEESLGEDDLVIHAEEDEIIEEGPIDCLPEACYKKFPIFAGDEDSPFWQGWGNLRLKTFRLIENKYFETAVITMILLSSLALVIYIHSHEILCKSTTNHARKAKKLN